MKISAAMTAGICSDNISDNEASIKGGYPVSRKIAGVAMAMGWQRDWLSQ